MSTELETREKLERSRRASLQAARAEELTDLRAAKAEALTRAFGRPFRVWKLV